MPRQGLVAHPAHEHEVVGPHEPDAWRPCEPSRRAIQLRAHRQRRQRVADAEVAAVTSEPACSPSHSSKRSISSPRMTARPALPTAYARHGALKSPPRRPTIGEGSVGAAATADALARIRSLSAACGNVASPAAVSAPTPFDTVKKRLPIPSMAAPLSVTVHETVCSPLVSAVVSRMRNPIAPLLFCKPGNVAAISGRKWL